jgi:hypothetical protein
LKPTSDSPDAVRAGRKRRVHSINFEPEMDDWLESLVELLKRAGLPRAGRSEVIRVALSALQRELVTQNPAETVTFFLERDVAWRHARIAPPDQGGTR